MPDADAPVFGLSMSQISRRVDGMTRVAGLGDGYSSHSGRVGLAVKQPMLLYMSSGFNEYLVWLADDRVDFTSDIAFKATDDFDLAHSFCGSSAQVRLRPQIVA